MRECCNFFIKLYKVFEGLATHLSIMKTSKHIVFFLFCISSFCFYAQSAKEYYTSGNLKYKLKDYRGAMVDYDLAIGLNPKYLEAYNERGFSKDQISDFAGAVDDFTKAIGLGGGSAETYYNRGFAKDEMLEYKGAEQDYTKAISLNPKFGKAYFNRGIAKNNLQDKKGACADWTKAGELGYMEAYDLKSKYCN